MLWIISTPSLVLRTHLTDINVEIIITLLQRHLGEIHRRATLVSRTCAHIKQHAQRYITAFLRAALANIRFGRCGLGVEHDLC